jgi:uncharacterized protein (TIGR02996 family)
MDVTQLMAQIIEAPDDDSPRLVLADLLEEAIREGS